MVFEMVCISKNVCTARFLDEMHPHVPEELYLRYLIPAQPHGELFNIDRVDVEWMIMFAMCVLRTDLYVYELFANGKSTKSEWQNATAWAERLSLLVGKGVVVNYSKRECPEWLFGQLEKAKGNDLNEVGDDESDKPGVNESDLVYKASPTTYVVRSSPLACLLLSITRRIHWTKITGVRSTMYLHGELRAAIGYDASGEICEMMGRMSHANKPVQMFPGETGILSVCGDYVVYSEGECGLHAFVGEKERVRSRNYMERELLFSEEQLVWTHPIPGDRFESLVQELLAREPGIEWIRSCSLTTEPDGGRDLLCRWRTPRVGVTSERTDEKGWSVVREVVVQCKGWKRNVNKSDVVDIVDTVVRHGSTGYFLAVASAMSRPLIDFLLGIRHRDAFPIWTDWWTREEIQLRLRRNPDIVDRFRDILAMG